MNRNRTLGSLAQTAAKLLQDGETDAGGGSAECVAAGGLEVFEGGGGWRLVAPRWWCPGYTLFAGWIASLRRELFEFCFSAWRGVERGPDPTIRGHSDGGDAA